MGKSDEIMQSIRAHVMQRNPKYICLVVPSTKLRELGYLNRANLEELLAYIKSYAQLIIKLDLENPSSCCLTIGEVLAIAEQS